MVPVRKFTNLETKPPETIPKSLLECYLSSAFYNQWHNNWKRSRQSTSGGTLLGMVRWKKKSGTANHFLAEDLKNLFRNLGPLEGESPQGFLRDQKPKLSYIIITLF